ncbi:MAG: LytTR family DNA-binding domain-containing protein [Bacteroidota bacterium]|nr:LytTR family DNA-binding domain-containing protein [Bacteroidota bacterium]
MVIQALVIDDEKANRINLIALLSEYCSDIVVVGEAGGLEEAYEKISINKPNLIFLDIRMPGGTAFDLLARFQTIDFEIIFITAYDEYALKAFRFNALDYILKPIRIAELLSSIERARMQLGNQIRDSRVLNYLINQRLDDQDKKIALPQEQQTQFIELRSIIRCEADSNYTKFFISNGQKLLVSKTLKEFAGSLEPLGFLRVHQSHLVNLHHVKAFKKGDGGYLETSDGNAVPVSRARRKYVLEILNNQ